MSEPKFSEIPDRERRMNIARSWIVDNDHFLFPLDGEDEMNHHARILVAYSFFENESLLAKVKLYEALLAKLGYMHEMLYEAVHG